MKDNNGNIVWGVLCAIGTACIMSLGFMDKPPSQWDHASPRNVVGVEWSIDSLNVSGRVMYTAEELGCKDLAEFYALETSIQDERIVHALDSVIFANHKKHAAGPDREFHWEFFLP